MSLPKLAFEVWPEFPFSGDTAPSRRVLRRRRSDGSGCILGNFAVFLVRGTKHGEYALLRRRFRY